MQEEGGGSFWATFGGGTNGAEASGLEKLLQTPKCSVEALLDEEEVIQEFKTGNPNLVARLSEPDAIKVLMDCITCDPPPEAGNARCYRYPFVAVELMTCAPPKFLRLLVSSESNAMEQLWCFLTTPPAEVNPVLAGYFSRTATALMSKHQKEVLEYLRLRGPERLLQEFLDRIHLRSLAELFARLLSGESESEVVFQTCDLVARLLRRWQEDSNSDAQENITLVLAELLNQKESLCWIEDLTQQLIEPRTVQFLIDHIFAQPSGVPPAMLLLTTVIVHTTAGLQEGTEVCATPSLSPLSVPPQLGEEPANLDEPVVGEAAATRAVPSTPHTSLKSTTSEWMERRRVHLMREVAGHFPSFRQLLDKSLEEGDTKMTMPQGSIKALGGTTLEVISLLTTLSRSGLDVVLEAMLNNQLLPRCVKVFFQHPWSSLLHNWVKQLVMEVLSGTDSLRKQLSQQLLQEASLAERIVEEYAQEASWKTKKQKHARVGYMGHVFLISSALQDCKSPEVAAVLSSTSGWSEVVAQLEATKKLHNEQLGGGVPASDRGLASSTRPTVTSDREGEDEAQVAVCPNWSKRVLGGNFLAAEPIDLAQDQDSKEESPPPFSNGPDAAVPNGQGSLPSSPVEDSFNPDFGAFDSAPSSGGASWASFPEVSAPSSFPEPSFPSFETEWPAPMESASQSSTNSGWASFNEPAGVPTPAPVVPKDERPPFDAQLFSTGGHNAPPSTPPPVRDSPPPFLNGPNKAVPNGQDSFNPDFADVFDSAPSSSSASWASFPDVAPSPSTSFPQLSFPTFETEWPPPVKSASQSSTNSGWASFNEPAGVPTPAPVVPKDERPPFDAQLFSTGGYTLPSTGSSLRDGSRIGDFDPLAPDLGSKPRGPTPWCGGVG